ncbi:heterokaryon incompatibility protein-domain-containing protein [Xylaria digitata]|nr:heterokaryon incompatibility protein-domain-containing protein [Xylaria digitata]
MEAFKGISPHRPLHKNGREIRIIRLLPNNFGSPVECALEHVFLGHEADYEAVSYCWGDASITTPILLGGKPYPITLNLLYGLKYLRQEESPRRLWVDSLCINQTDVTERNREILKMRDIYKLARSVLIWLGDYHPFTRLYVKQVFDYVTTLANRRDEKEDMTLIRSIGYDELWHMHSQLQEFIRTREWFQRMWILQEVSVRPKPYMKDVAISPNLICGDLVLPFAHLRAVDEYWVTNTDNKRIGLEPICPSLDRIKVIWYGYQTIVLDEEDSTVAQRFAWVLALVAARFHATDRRDIVYATLGLLNADPLPMELLPDYCKSPIKILIECASFIITHSRILTILQYNSMCTKGLPTWVPDWQHDSWCPIVFGAEPHIKTHARVLRDIGALEVDIIALAEVSRVGPRLERRDTAESLTSTWSNFFLDAEEHLAKNGPPIWGYSSFGKALWQLLLVFDLSRQGLHEPGWHLGVAEHVPPFFFWERSPSPDSKSKQGLQECFLEEALAALESTVPEKFLLRNTDGSIGIMCQPNVKPQKDDMICTIKGSHADFVLREYLDGYKIIGRCERSKRGGFTIGDTGLHRWAGTTHLYAFYEELWTTSDGHRILIY